MKKIFFSIVLAVLFSCEMTFAQGSSTGTTLLSKEKDYNRPLLLGLNLSVGCPIVKSDLTSSFRSEKLIRIDHEICQGAGVDVQLGFDFAYPITDKFAMGFCTSAGAGFTHESYYRYFYRSNPYEETEKRGRTNLPMFKLSLGILMEIGELNKSPFLFSVSPLGFALVNSHLYFPLEIRFGRVFPKHWYIMGEIVAGSNPFIKPTLYIEPSIRVGYNFGHNLYAHKKI